MQLVINFVSGGSTAEDFLDRVNAGVVKLFESFKNDATMKCLYEHIAEKENMVVAIAKPFGVSVECMKDWNCFYCVDKVQEAGPRLMLDLLKVVLDSLTVQELESMTMAKVCVASALLTAGAL